MAQSVGEIQYNLRKLSPEVTMTIVVYETHEYRMRKAIALALIGLAGRILGMSVKVEENK